MQLAPRTPRDAAPPTGRASAGLGSAGSNRGSHEVWSTFCYLVSFSAFKAAPKDSTFPKLSATEAALSHEGFTLISAPRLKFSIDRL